MPLLYVTGDVHNALTIDRAHFGIHEPSAAFTYARIAADAGIRVNFFLTGCAVLEDTAVFRSIAALGNVEYGGHGWDSFRHFKMRTLLWCAFGTRYGPRALQRLEIERTKTAFDVRLGIPCMTWRSHAYYADANTYPLLAAAGVHVVSDHVGPDTGMGELLPGLWSVPINTTPDHDSVAHGLITQATVDLSAKGARAFRDLEMDSGLSWKQRLAILGRRACRTVVDIPVLPSAAERLYAGNKIELLEPRLWEKRLEQQIEERLAASGFATLLLHPVCMAALDDFAAFRRIASFCRRFETGYLSEAPATGASNSIRALSS